MTDAARGVVLDDRYRIDEVIGIGGMATVYRATDRVLGRKVAVKLFPPSPVEDERLREQAEITVLAGLDHPGLVTLLDSGSCYAGGPAPQTYIVMELVAGPTLADVVREGPLTRSATAVIGRQLADALAAVHAGQVVHRDVKPANVLFAEPLHPDAATARVKLADFGIARALDASRLTMTGLTMGTATYLSPEQAAGSAVGTATDVYSLGLVLLECLTGQKAFTGSMVEVAAARLTTSPVIPASLGPTWAGLIAGMTHRDPHERLGLGEVARRLDDLAVEDDLPTTEPTMVLKAALVPADASDRPTEARDVLVRGAESRLTRRRSPQGPLLWVTTAVTVLVVAVVLAVARPAADARGDVEPPSRPDVPGALGVALADLVESVQP